mmetsp:Transcript_77945/g.223348  ORF Transcript_77945/g.223348 Transcript_77945/m.223348 type:complete len:260 (+) Transcript_77945:586-1365(+)
MRLGVRAAAGPLEPGRRRGRLGGAGGARALGAEASARGRGQQLLRPRVGRQVACRRGPRPVCLDVEDPVRFVPRTVLERSRRPISGGRELGARHLRSPPDAWRGGAAEHGRRSHTPHQARHLARGRRLRRLRRARHALPRGAGRRNPRRRVSGACGGTGRGGRGLRAVDLRFARMWQVHLLQGFDRKGPAGPRADGRACRRVAPPVLRRGRGGVPGCGRSGQRRLRCLGVAAGPRAGCGLGPGAPGEAERTSDGLGVGR